MSLTRVTAQLASTIAHLNQYADHLEGVAGNTMAWLLRVAASENFVIILADNAGVSKFLVKDLAGNTVATIDSDGNLTIAGGFTPGSLTLPSAASPAPTADGQLIWDSDDNRITVGDGAATQTFYPGLYVPKYKYKTTGQNFTTTTLADVTATSGNIAFAVEANKAYMIEITGVLSAVGTAGSGGIKFSFTGPASPTIARAWCYATYYLVDSVPTLISHPVPVNVNADMVDITFGTTTFGASVSTNNTNTGGYTPGTFTLRLHLVNGANAGTVTLQAAQNIAAGTSTITKVAAVCTQLMAE